MAILTNFELDLAAAKTCISSANREYKYTRCANSNFLGQEAMMGKWPVTDSNERPKKDNIVCS